MTFLYWHLIELTYPESSSESRITNFKDIFVQIFENQTFKTKNHLVILWETFTTKRKREKALKKLQEKKNFEVYFDIRYFNDSFMVLPKSKVDYIVDLFNSQDPHLKLKKTPKSFF